MLRSSNRLLNAAYRDKGRRSFAKPASLLNTRYNVKEWSSNTTFLKPSLTQSSIGSISELQTSAVNNDSCLPTPLPPKCGPTNCIIPKPNIWRDCKVRKRPKWTGCDKICMPCCCPVYSPPDCDQIEIRQNTCKRLEYRIPSYSECRKFPIGKKTKKECCYTEPICPEAGIETIVTPLISTKVRQETLLGRRTGGRHFSTSALAMSDACGKVKQTCLKPSGVTSTAINAKNKKECTKQCMPCCAPARDPPECYYPYVKTECNRAKPPRPAFSECEKQKAPGISVCECRTNVEPCRNTVKSSSGSC